ncbi:hypothetical protein PVAND_003812 [Polypedilum vanderplanki]|uniref:Uncharacterized protein n=1 Tax=Polypedilum vanderplanki TaxID=319348 RepID=A0A9J6BVP5_POLVA|nr:hypothetical protein PVAND_003812 [Polypedilum vanderplanki]
MPYQALSLRSCAAQGFVTRLDNCFLEDKELILSDEEIYFLIHLLRHNEPEFLEIICNICINFSYLLPRFIKFNLVPAFLNATRRHFEDDVLQFSCYNILTITRALIKVDSKISDEIILSLYNIIAPQINQRYYTASTFIFLCLPPTNPCLLQLLIPAIIEILNVPFQSSQCHILKALNNLVQEDDKFTNMLACDELIIILTALCQHINYSIARIAKKIINAINSFHVYDDIFNIFDA